MRASISNLSSLALLLLYAATLHAQPDIAPSPEVHALTESSNPNTDEAQGLIKLDVLVTDHSGKPISGLTREDFTLLDNSQPQKILSFQPSDKHDPPVELILLIDTLNVPAPLAMQEREGVARFLRQNAGHLAQPVSISNLSENGLAAVGELSRNGNELASAVEHRDEVLIRSSLPQPKTGFLRDMPTFKEPVTLTALKALGEIATRERKKPGRKLLLWIGPGSAIGTGAFPKDLGNGQTLMKTADWFSTLLREARIALYALSVGQPNLPTLSYTSFLDGAKSPRQITWINLYKKVLAVQSGGRALESSEDLVNQIESCIQEANIFYTLSFDPPHADHLDEYHDLKVQISQTNLTARTKTGYYDQPYYSDEPNPAVKSVTLEQLEQRLRAAHGKRDVELARELSRLVLTERLSTSKLSSWTTEFPSEKTLQELMALADAYAFLAPPKAEIPGDSPPDSPTQRHMMSLAVDSLNSTIPALSKLLATRTTVRYEEAPQGLQGDTRIDYQPLHRTDTSTATVVYRHGDEVVDSKALNQEKRKAEGQSLTINGTFGPLLTAAVDILANPDHLTWSRWGQSASGRIAVFHYVVPAESLSYQVGGCCLPDGDGTTAFRRPSRYRGEIEIDPTSGALLRLEIEPDLKSTTPFTRSDVMIKYGPVQIGGKAYICPLRSVSISRVRSVNFFRTWDEGFRAYGPYSTLLNDITFADYHAFRAQSRILDSASSQPQ